MLLIRVHWEDKLKEKLARVHSSQLESARVTYRRQDIIMPDIERDLTSCNSSMGVLNKIRDQLFINSWRHHTAS